MRDYYSYFQFDVNTTISEVIDKMTAFLSCVRDEVTNLDNDEEKRFRLTSALNIVKDVCQMFSTTHDRGISREYLKSFSSKSYKIKRDVPHLEDLCNQIPTAEIRMLNCLIPYLERENQMSFLENEMGANELLTFIVKNADDYCNKCDKNGGIVSLDIIKNSFNIAKGKGHCDVKVEDIVTSINNCQLLDKKKVIKFAVMVFDKWYRNIASNAEGTYQKKLV